MKKRENNRSVANCCSIYSKMKINNLINMFAVKLMRTNQQTRELISI